MSEGLFFFVIGIAGGAGAVIHSIILDLRKAVEKKKDWKETVDWSLREMSKEHYKLCFKVSDLEAKVAVYGDVLTAKEKQNGTRKRRA